MKSEKIYSTLAQFTTKNLNPTHRMINHQYNIIF